MFQISFFLQNTSGWLLLNTYLYVFALLKWNCPANICLLKVTNNNRKRFEICSNVTIKTPKRRYWRHSGVFIVTFEWTYFTLFADVSIVDFEQGNFSWVYSVERLQWSFFCKYSGWLKAVKYFSKNLDIDVWQGSRYVYFIHVTITCSNSTTETIKKGVKYVQS